ncbi:MAG: hypothetical protein KKB03_01815 [Nanoarchaeota archaeon]|nr:hypothetical protein [Nanoarchaeota archaeon]MBU1134962.1 hypothetical protein [Nanoarchaeota archaeon]MBU2519963.1 hypothetical protein [Nanoarchaeota archaeon]
MLKESISRAVEFSSRIGEVDSKIVVLDADEKGLVLYSNEKLYGYEPDNGVFAKRLDYDQLTNKQKEFMEISADRGPESKDFGSVDINEAAFEKDILGVRKRNASILEHYCFIPTKEAANLILSEKYGYRLKELLDSDIVYNYPIDILLVHKLLHGALGFNGRADLCRELEQRGYIEKDIDYGVVDELFSKLGDIFYLKENNSEFADKREAKNLREAQNFRNRKKEDDMDAYIHDYASKLYFQIKNDRNVWPFVKLMFSEPYDG